MATSGMNIEYALETGIITELAKRTYFAQGGAGAGTSIIHFMDNSIAERPMKYVVVHAQPAERIQPNYPYYKVSVSLVSLSHIPNDKSRASCRTLYQECLDFIQKFDKGAVSTASGLTIDGSVAQGGAESADFGENYQNQIANFDVYLTKT
ncbi:MAG TPA: hypothetical protein DET40_21715 [Lentisphaeria bacterium]|nr:hypothetical protein [Lentisphaeria bacterium]